MSLKRFGEAEGVVHHVVEHCPFLHPIRICEDCSRATHTRGVGNHFFKRKYHF